jgi:hypothetical protein
MAQSSVDGELIGIDIPPHTCPVCKRVNDAVTCPTDSTARPSTGDISICFTCGSISVFEADFTLRSLKDFELEEEYDVAQRLELAQLQQRIRELHPLDRN